MKCLATEDADEFLGLIGMQIGRWDEIADADIGSGAMRRRVKYKAPNNAKRLFVFS